MKNRLVLALLALLLVMGLLTGCTTSLKESYTGTTYNIGVPAAKDVKILGIVRVETQVTGGMTGGMNGEKITYDALLRAAEEKGGNGIVNIMIDVKREKTGFMSLILNSTDTWYGSALAIKYTDENLAMSTTVDGVTKSGVEASKSVAPLEPGVFGGGGGGGITGLIKKIPVIGGLFGGK